MIRGRSPQMLALGGVILLLVAIVVGLSIWLVILLWRGLPQGQPVLPGSQTPLVVGPNATLPAPTPTLAIAAWPTVAPLPTSAVEIEQLLAQMSLEEKAGQMIMTGLPGQTFDLQAASLIEDYHFGSVVYFARNAHGPEQTLRLSQDLQQAAAASGQGVPLLIAIDHEGGRVFRFDRGLTHFPSPMALGAAGSPDLAYQSAMAAGQELLAVGINTSLAPVLDVNDEPLNPAIGLRAFAGYPGEVTQIGMAYLRGLQDAGLVAAAKHFPGHGSTLEDSHLTLPVVNKTPSEWVHTELPPFQAAVQNGVGLILVGHISFPQLDPSGEPASLSPLLVQGRLRGDLGYQGVVMSDALSMGAITSRYTTEQAVLKAVLAGVDLLAYPEAELAVAAHRAILAGVQRGEIPQARVDEAARRVLLLKQRYGLFGPRTSLPLQTHEPLALQAAQRAIAFSGQGQAPLVRLGRLLLVSPSAFPPGSRAGDNLSYLGELLQKQGVEVEEWIYSVEDSGQAAVIQAQVQVALPSYPQAVIVLWDALLARSQQGNLSQVNLLEAALASGTPLVVVAASSPFDLSLLPAGQPALATFGGLDYQVEALAEALLAGALPTGKMPVEVRR